MGDETGCAGDLLEAEETSRAALLRQITEEGGFAFVSSVEKAAAGDLRAAEAAHEMAWEQLHSGPWNEVSNFTPDNSIITLNRRMRSLFANYTARELHEP